jgi:hypothetical protein
MVFFVPFFVFKIIIVLSPNQKNIKIMEKTEIQIRDWTLSKKFIGHGHYKVTLDIDVNGHIMVIDKVVTDMTIIDNWTDNHVYQSLCDRIFDENQEKIDEFVAVVHAQKSL